MVVAAFGDPGLGGLREALPCPVTGLTEAALASACLLGGRFSIVAISQRIRAWYRETVEHNGLIGRLASIRGLDEPLADIGSVQAPGTGLNLGIAARRNGIYLLGFLARFLQLYGDGKILSTPNLLTLDNEEAKIVVGENVPFITGQFTSTGGTATTNPFQTIERKDVGITLRIKPQIGENGTVRMAIFQESSSVSDKVAPGTSNAGPSTTKRSIESQVVVEDGQIIVLGGLIEDTVTVDKSKVPLLGDIPYLGALFRNKTRQVNKTELLIFLTPKVVTDRSAVR